MPENINLVSCKKIRAQTEGPNGFKVYGGLVEYFARKFVKRLNQISISSAEEGLTGILYLQYPP
jgi:hypothetical protein